MKLIRSVLAATLVIGLGAATAIAAPAAVRTFVVAPDMHTPNEVSFTSRASIVRFTGRTSKVTGTTVLHVDNVAASTGTVQVDLASLDTGIPLRNDHMRGVLGTDKHPTATFVMKKLTVPGNKITPGSALTGTVSGTMTLHGVTRPVSAPVTLIYLPEQDAKYRPGDWVQVESRFKLKLSDYGIQLPAGVLGVKVADEVAINVDGMAKAK